MNADDCSLLNLAYINPNMLVYYRKRAKLSQTDAAKGICLRYELEHAEIGIKRITMTQLRLFANKYSVNITAFYQQQVPTKKQEFHGWVRKQLIRIISDLVKSYNIDSNELGL